LDAVEIAAPFEVCRMSHFAPRGLVKTRALYRLRATLVRGAFVLAVMLVGQLTLSAILARQALATLDTCTVVAWTPDGFLSLRTGPGVHFPEIMRLASGTIIAIDDLQGDPARRWVHVTGVIVDGRLVPAEGWVNQRYLRGSIDCPG
jgi:hypothetical protein